MALLDTFALTPDPRWLITFDGYDAGLEGSIEAVMALVNGYGGTRAALDEHGPHSRPAMFIGGVFNTPAAPQDSALEAPIPELVVTPEWSRLRVVIDGAPLDLSTCTLLGQRRTLDMRQGALLREWRVQDAQGRITALRSLRFASLADRHLLAQSVSVTPENYAAELTVELTVDAAVTNANHTVHLRPLSAHPDDAQSASIAVETTQSGYRVGLAAAAWHAGVGGGPDGLAELTVEENRITHRWVRAASAGQTLTFEKLVSVASSRESQEPPFEARARLAAACETGLDAVFQAHSAAWAAAWERADITVTGDDDIQRESRFASYHLIGAANPYDQRCSVGARAMTGERYRGHVFWDTETFVWPFYLFTEPLTARSLLAFRHHTLAGARDKARSLGFRGALYPWEVTNTGAETTPPFVLNPAGERLVILTGVEEHHLAADIAYAIDQYIQASDDEGFLLRYGAEMFLDIANFWSSRAVAGAAGQYHIRTVIGPDEYHDSVDDNAYTNVMAAWCLRRGLALAARLERAHPAEWLALRTRLGLTAQLLAHWQAVADGLVTGLDSASGVFEQFAGYNQLEELDLSDHDTAAATLDVRLGWARLQELKVIKQADVVMLVFLLWEQLTPEQRLANFRYYEPRTTHDSSLSPSMHALVAARLGDLDLAVRYLRQAARIDLDFSRKGWAGASGGIHIAALGGIWQALVYGFLGMRPSDDGLRFAPNIPAAWTSISAPIQWRGRQLRVTVANGVTELTLVHGAPLAVALHDGPWQTLTAGAAVRG